MRGHRRSSRLNGLRPNPHAGRSASSTPKRHASSFVNRPAARYREGFHFACVRAYVNACCTRTYTLLRIYRTKARRKFYTLFLAGGIIVQSLTPLLYPTIFRENKRAVPDYVLRKSTEMTFNKPRACIFDVFNGINICYDNFVNIS